MKWRIVSYEKRLGRYFCVLERPWLFFFKKRMIAYNEYSEYSGSRWYLESGLRFCGYGQEGWSEALTRQLQILRDADEELEKLLEQEERPRRLKAVKALR